MEQKKLLLTFVWKAEKNSKKLEWLWLSIAYNHHGAEISVIWLVEQSAIKLLIFIRY